MLKNKKNWISNQGMRIHVWWHLSIFYLFNLDLQEVTNIMMDNIMCKNDEKGLEDLDAIALLWRLYLLDENMFISYKTLNNWDKYLENNHFIFNDLHALMAYILKNDVVRIEKLLIKVKQRENKYKDEDYLTLLYGFYYFSKKEYNESANNLNIILNQSKFGGSNAQRDIISLTLLISLIKSGRNKEAKNLLDNDRAFKHDSKMKKKLLKDLGVG